MKYDWKHLKTEFMASNCPYVKRWWKERKNGPVNGHFYRMTSGWYSEKWRKKMENRNSSFRTQ